MNQQRDHLLPLRSDFACDPEMADLVREFVGELPDRVRKLADAAAEGKADDVRRLAHQLKGSSGGYGFACIGNVAATIEDAIHSASGAAREQALRSVLGQIDELNTLCQRAVAGLNTPAAGR